MKMHSKKEDAVFVVIGLMLLALIMFSTWCGVKAGKSKGIGIMQKEAIQRNYAEYNSTTGEWQWRETEVIVEDKNVEQNVEQ
jgi:hypothetical protein